MKALCSSETLENTFAQKCQYWQFFHPFRYFIILPKFEHVFTDSAPNKKQDDKTNPDCLSFTSVPVVLYLYEDRKFFESVFDSGVCFTSGAIFSEIYIFAFEVSVPVILEMGGT